jgi:hypothetical protein
MRHDAGQLAGDGAVDGLGDVEVGWEEDVKVPLVNLAKEREGLLV